MFTPMATTAPGPTDNPLTGQLKPFESSPLHYLTAVHAEYGDVVRLRLWPHLVHLVCHPDDIRHVLVTQGEHYHEMSALGLRGVAPKHLQGHSIGAMVDEMVAAASAMLDRWTARSDPDPPTDLAREMRRLTLDVLGRTVLGAGIAPDLGALEPALAVASRFTAPHRSLSIVQRLERSRDGAGADVEGAVATLQAFAREMIDRRRRSDAAPDLASDLLDSGDDDYALVSLLALLVAGHESTASALTWTLLLLADHPEARVMVERELETELHGRPPQLDDLSRLRRTRMALQEAMRLFPPVWLLAPRVAQQEDVVGGYSIPKGSIVIVSPYVTHRDAERWPQPHVFDPDRFSDAAPTGYLPFGAGPWGCIGTQFGMTEARLVLAMILQRFECERVSMAPLEADPRSALWPTDAEVVLRPRR